MHGLQWTLLQPTWPLPARDEKWAKNRTENRTWAGSTHSLGLVGRMLRWACFPITALQCRPCPGQTLWKHRTLTPSTLVLPQPITSSVLNEEQPLPTLLPQVPRNGSRMVGTLASPNFVLLYNICLMPGALLTWACTGLVGAERGT